MNKAVITPVLGFLCGHKFSWEMLGTSLVVQWLTIYLQMQGTRVQSLVWEDSACCSATKPMCHNYWAQALLKPASSKAHALQQEKPPQWEALAPQLERSPHSPYWRRRPHSPQLEKSPRKEACAPRLESIPCSLQLGKARRQQTRPSAAKKKERKKEIFKIKTNQKNPIG